jgi:hypothetical protein
MFNLNAASQGVSVDSSTGRPREIRTQGVRLAVTELEAIRDETAAYPLESGPRTVFVVRTRERRYRLIHLLRDERWMIEELAPTASGLAQAA